MTQNERIADMHAQGLTNVEIARELNVGVWIVQRKLHVLGLVHSARHLNRWRVVLMHPNGEETLVGRASTQAQATELATRMNLDLLNREGPPTTTPFPFYCVDVIQLPKHLRSVEAFREEAAHEHV